MVDRIRRIDPELQSRLHEIRAYLERNAIRGTQIRLLNGNDRWNYRKHYPKHTEVNLLKNKPLQQILDEVKQE